MDVHLVPATANLVYMPCWKSLCIVLEFGNGQQLPKQPFLERSVSFITLARSLRSYSNMRLQKTRRKAIYHWIHINHDWIRHPSALRVTFPTGWIRLCKPSCCRCKVSLERSGQLRPSFSYAQFLGMRREASAVQIRTVEAESEWPTMVECWLRIGVTTTEKVHCGSTTRKESP